MAEKEIILQGEDGQVDELVLTTQDQASCNSLEDCVRMLFPQEGENKPRLRFKGFEGDWVTTKLCQISKKVTTKNTDLKYRTTLTNSAEKGIVNQLDYFDHDVSNEDNISGYYVVENDDFVYNPRISATAPVGPINRNQLGYAGVMSPLYYVFRVDGIDKDYLSYFFKTTLWHKYMFDNGNNGARYDRFSISDEVFGQMPIIHPKDIEEQRQIASLLKRLDSQIEHYQQQFDQLKQLKSACLERMFPQQGDSVPSVRFKGFEGDWQKKELENCLEISEERNMDNHFGINDVLSVSDDFGVVNQIELLGRSYAGKSVSGYKVFRPGQIVYTKSPLKAKPYGIVKQNTGEVGIVSVLYAIYDTKEGVAPDYIHYYFDPAWRLNAYMRPLVNKGAKNTMNISDETALTGYIMIPKDIEEQRRIAAYLRSLDEQIAVQQQQLERLKQMKQSCLGLLFPDNQSITPPPQIQGI